MHPFVPTFSATYELRQWAQKCNMLALEPFRSWLRNAE